MADTKKAKVKPAIKKKRKAKPCYRACQEVRQYQKGTGNLIARAAVKRMIRSIMAESMSEPKMTKNAIDILQWDVESFMCAILRDAKERAELSGRKTCTAEHLKSGAEQRHYIGCLQPADMKGLVFKTKTKSQTSA